MEENNIPRLRGPDVGYLTIDQNSTIRSCNEKAAAILNIEYTQLYIDSKLIAVLAADKRFQKLHDRLDRGLHLLENGDFSLQIFVLVTKRVLRSVSSPCRTVMAI